MLGTLLIILAVVVILVATSLLLTRKAEVQARERFRSAVNYPVGGHRMGRFYGYPLAPDHHYVEGVGYIFGDLTCCFNARSPYLRCAINPAGPCKECPYYKSIEFKDS